MHIDLFFSKRQTSEPGVWKYKINISHHGLSVSPKDWQHT